MRYSLITLPWLLLIVLVAPVRADDCDRIFADTEVLRDSLRAEARDGSGFRPATLRRFANAARAGRV